MLCGLPGSGKSFYAEKLGKEGYKIHSYDSIREEWFGSEDVQDKDSLIFTALHNNIFYDLEMGYDCVYDGTNINSKRRVAFINTLTQRKIVCVKEIVIFATPYEKCLEQNNIRDRKVPNHIIENMYKNFQLPYYYEGWDFIDIIWNINGYRNWSGSKLVSSLSKYNQKNTHHRFTLGKHLYETWKIAANNNISYPATQAAFYHDIGKPFCKTFLNKRGEKSENAHYYNHENVSAYLSLFYLKYSPEFESEDKTVLYVASLINNHMKPYTWKMDKTKNKYKKFWGEQYYNDIMDLHKADMEAH